MPPIASQTPSGPSQPRSISASLEPKRAHATQRCRKPPLARQRHAHPSLVSNNQSISPIHLCLRRTSAYAIHAVCTARCTQIHTHSVSTPIYPRARVTRSRLFIGIHANPLYTRACHSTPGKKPSAASASGDCDQTAAPLVKVETADLPTWDEISA
jgi:hypothetical protein